jgi:hypothetical protein
MASGISHDLSENKPLKNRRWGISHDVYDNKRLIEKCFTMLLKIREINFGVVRRLRGVACQATFVIKSF